MHVRSILLTGLSALLFVGFSRVPFGEPGDRYSLSPNGLPAPRTTLPNEIDPRNEAGPPGFLPRVPPGFSVSVFASAPELNVRWIKVAPNGDVFLAERASGQVTLLRDADGDGKAERIVTFAKGFTQPHGMAFTQAACMWRTCRRSGAFRMPTAILPPARPPHALLGLQI
jgi:glucose/arabinose dehydrogenase